MTRATSGVTGRGAAYSGAVSDLAAVLRANEMRQASARPRVVDEVRVAAERVAGFTAARGFWADVTHLAAPGWCSLSGGPR